MVARWIDLFFVLFFLKRLDFMHCHFEIIWSLNPFVCNLLQQQPVRKLSTDTHTHKMYENRTGKKPRSRIKSHVCKIVRKSAHPTPTAQTIPANIAYHQSCNFLCETYANNVLKCMFAPMFSDAIFQDYLQDFFFCEWEQFTHTRRTTNQFIHAKDEDTKF